MAALLPTLSARPNPQLIYTSSAGMLDSFQLNSVRERGLRGDDPRLCYLEWSTEPGADPLDREQWALANPALGGRIDAGFVEMEQRSLPAREFARERLSIWSTEQDEPVLDPVVWDALTDRAPNPRRPILALEVALDRSSAVLAAAWKPDDRPHVEIIDRQPGVDWVVERVRYLTKTYGAKTLVLDAAAEAVSLAEQLAKVVTVERLIGVQRAQACGLFFDAAMTGQLSHDDDPLLAETISNARWKDVGDGLRTFSRRASAGDISDLYAVTFALWGVSRVKRLPMASSA